MASMTTDVTVLSGVAMAPSRRWLTFWVMHVAFWAAAFAANLLVIAVFQPEVADPAR